MRERHQMSYLLRNMLLIWPGRESGTLQGMHHSTLQSNRPDRCHSIGMERGSFIFEGDKYITLIRYIAHSHLPDSLESLRTFRRLIEELTRYLRSGFLENVRGNYQGHYNVFLFTHEARCKNTERPDVSCWIRLALFKEALR